MVKNMNNIIHIREECRSFPIKKIAKLFSPETSIIEKWVNDRKSLNSTYLFSMDELEKIVHLDGIPRIIPSKEFQKNVQDLIEVEFVQVEKGLFTVTKDYDAKSSNLKNFIHEYGIWNAQGLNNHEDFS